MQSPTPFSIVLLEKLIVAQLIKKYPSFYCAGRFITVFIRLTTIRYSELDESNLHPYTLFL
jgi:hypothetical protein